MKDYDKSHSVFKGSFLFEPLLIGCLWLLLFSAPLLFGQVDGGINWNNVFKVWKDDVLLLAVFLINRYLLLPFLFFREHRISYLLTTAMLIAALTAGRFYFYKSGGGRNVVNSSQVQPERRPPANADRPLANNRTNRPGRQDQRNQPEPVPPYMNLLILSVLIVGFDTGLRVTSRWSQSERQRMSLEKENIENQLAFLRTQISPHFFMNTLNNIHALIDYDAGTAKTSIIKLSNLMRHLLYDSDSELSTLDKEIEFIKSYVDLMKLRFSKKVSVTLDLPERIPDRTIPPLLFTSLLENAFKHGISYTSESYINIKLSVANDFLTFSIDNSKVIGGPLRGGSGIGIENSRRRLELLYGENYQLEIIDKGNVFVTNMRIPL
jgi:hypothetical protein